ncbi:MAG TPA: Thivi_2564 family membrane protein [Candidatus Sulfopaludibacter sp.]|jgi:undecaprenyl pyrophosphate phosphatase UppP|nr:Thivi_2564 family membrane protein [Candidatus Sulfopaludibacter sp.]
MPFVTIAIALIFVLAIARLANMYIPMPPTIKAILNVCLGLIVIGMVLWVIDTYIPMAGAIKGLLNVVVFLAAVVGVLQALGFWDSTVRFFRGLKHKTVAEDHVTGERLPH